MIAESKIIEIFYVINEFDRNYDKEIFNHVLISSAGILFQPL